MVDSQNYRALIEELWLTAFQLISRRRVQETDVGICRQVQRSLSVGMNPDCAGAEQAGQALSENSMITSGFAPTPQSVLRVRKALAPAW
jgi:hypothetical protein